MDLNQKKVDSLLLASKFAILIIAIAPVSTLQYLHSKYNLSYISILAPLVGAFMLFWGVYIKHKLYKNSFEMFNLKKWSIALLLFLGMEFIQLLLVIPSFNFDTNLFNIFYRAFFLLVLVGYTEELWFRGILFEMFKGRFIPCVILGSFLFGLMHLPGRDFGTFIFTSIAGITFAVARFRGSSILSLAIAHGVMDFLNQSAFSGELRFSPLLAVLVYPLACLLLSGILMLIFKPCHYQGEFKVRRTLLLRSSR